MDSERKEANEMTQQTVYYVYNGSMWRGFSTQIGALLFAKINGFNLIAKGK
jgi:hypothetical protein